VRAVGRTSEGTRLRHSIIALVLFAVAFAYVESAVVIYLRMIYEPIRAKYQPAVPSGELLPCLTIEQLAAEGAVHRSRLLVELGREGATLIMLASAAAIGARSFGQWLAGFMLAFGVWDIFYYVWLKVCIGWPSSLMQWDILFLIPTLWAGPVVAPIIVSLSMVAAAGIVYRCEAAGKALRLPWWSWVGILSGALILIVAFCWDWRWLAGGNVPRGFPWWLFGIGEGVGFGAFVLGLRPGAGRGRTRAGTAD
jgi:hypothetical protein